MTFCGHPIVYNSFFFFFMFHPFSFHSSAYFTLCWCIAIGNCFINFETLQSFVLIFDWFEQTEHFHYDEWASWKIILFSMQRSSFFICLIFNLWFIGVDKRENASTYIKIIGQRRISRKNNGQKEIIIQTLIKSFVLYILLNFEQMNFSH